MYKLSVRSYFVMVVLAVLGGCAGEVDAVQGEVEAASEALSRAPQVPDVLKVPDGHKYAFLLDAAGLQIYECRTSATAPSGYAWTLVAPDADLFKANGRIAGSHYGGPSWEYLDGSVVVGARAASHIEDPGSIPWLLLSATAHPGVEGKMSNVSYIHRLDTSGGLAPATGCDAEHVGDDASVEYTATYYFYVPRACH